MHISGEPRSHECEPPTLRTNQPIHCPPFRPPGDRSGCLFATTPVARSRASRPRSIDEFGRVTRQSGRREPRDPGGRGLPWKARDNERAGFDGVSESRTPLSGIPFDVWRAGDGRLKTRGRRGDPVPVACLLEAGGGSRCRPSWRVDGERNGSLVVHWDLVATWTASRSGIYTVHTGDVYRIPTRKELCKRQIKGDSRRLSERSTWL